MIRGHTLPIPTSDAGASRQPLWVLPPDGLGDQWIQISECLHYSITKDADFAERSSSIFRNSSRLLRFLAPCKSSINQENGLVDEERFGQDSRPSILLSLHGLNVLPTVVLHPSIQCHLVPFSNRPEFDFITGESGFFRTRDTPSACQSRFRSQNANASSFNASGRVWEIRKKWKRRGKDTKDAY